MPAGSEKQRVSHPWRLLAAHFAVCLVDLDSFGLAGCMLGIQVLLVHIPSCTNS